jgi:photosystem II stability/assembly factor-like uncharacterized protein
MLMVKVKSYIWLILIISTCCNAAIFAQNYWSRIDSPTDNFLRTLCFLDSLRGYVAGDSGLILYTSNGGDNWTEQQSNTSGKIVEIFFLNDDMGWALAWSEGLSDFFGTYILTTTNGGNDWIEEEFRQENIFLYAVYFQDSVKGFLGGNPGGIFKTTDGGVTWDSAAIANAPFAYFPILKFNFFNDQYGFACGGAHDIAGITWKTTDGGDYWVPIDAAYTPPDEIWDIYFIDSANVVGVGGDPELFGVGILRSNDAGKSWSYSELGLIGMARALSFRTDYECWAPVPIPESLIQSVDTANTWTFYPAIDSSRIYDLAFADSLIGYAVGEGGVILKYKYPIVNSIEGKIEAAVNNFALEQNYPNPFNPITTIKYTLDRESHISLVIYDVLGKEIEKLVDQNQQAGNYEVRWEAKDFPSGIYYYQFKSGDFSDSKKMILLR